MPRRLPLVNKLPSHLGDGVLSVLLALAGVWLAGFVGTFVARSAGFIALWEGWLALSTEALGAGRLWTLLTYGLLHDLASPLHIAFNLFGFYVLAPPMEARWGARGLLRFLGLCVFGGGVAAAIASGAQGDGAITVGASAAVMGLLVGWAIHMPTAKMLLFFVFPIQIRHLVWLALGLDAALAATGSDVSFSAHLGGALTAWLQLGGGRWLWARLQSERALRETARRQRALRQRLRVLPGGRDDERPS
jgi:membrane associated rhomboid family serine protease